MHTSGVSQNTSESQCLMESNCAGLILHRQKPPLTRRSLVYYCSGVHRSYFPRELRFGQYRGSGAFPVGPLPVPVIEPSFRAVLVFPVGVAMLLQLRSLPAAIPAVGLSPQYQGSRVMPVEGRDLSSRATHDGGRDMRTGESLTARGGSLRGRVTSAIAPDVRRRDEGDALPSVRSGNTADGAMPP